MTLTRRPLGLALAPRPERPACAPTMTWAEMAAAEGHRPGLPGDPAPKRGGRKPGPTPAAMGVLRKLAERGPSTRSDLTPGRHARASIAGLLAAGLVREEPAPTSTHPHRVLLALTEAGRAHLEGLT